MSQIFHMSLHSKFAWILAVIITLNLARVCVADEKVDMAEKTTHGIAQSVMSPFCPGRTLDDCPSSAASELRNKITDMLLAGKTEDQVVENLYALYGEQIRSVPKKEGFGLVAWIMPAVFLLGGLLILVIWISRTQSVTSKQLSEVTLDPKTEARIKAEIEGIS